MRGFRFKSAVYLESEEKRPEAMCNNLHQNLNLPSSKSHSPNKLASQPVSGRHSSPMMLSQSVLDGQVVHDILAESLLAP